MQGNRKWWKNKNSQVQFEPGRNKTILGVYSRQTHRLPILIAFRWPERLGRQGTEEYRTIMGICVSSPPPPKKKDLSSSYTSFKPSSETASLFPFIKGWKLRYLAKAQYQIAGLRHRTRYSTEMLKAWQKVSSAYSTFIFVKWNLKACKRYVLWGGGGYSTHTQRCRQKGKVNSGYYPGACWFWPAVQYPSSVWSKWALFSSALNSSSIIVSINYLWFNFCFHQVLLPR